MAANGDRRSALAQTLADITDVDTAAQRVSAARGTYRADFINDAVIRQQQTVADAFFALKGIPSRIDGSTSVQAPALGVRFTGVSQ